ncbi:bifunctional riboflavin kinase/FAD synthetase [Geovibrio thiophilus]|uniref:Riboflavin biosynthesis protein n=2 Tax=Geovibrio thiophilus TaxID=139438 RepID=A0A410K2G7_9BACT|nr:bifunctional riboflavin kinase/FAD synthetase [Geovibrio thiophilus]
MQVIRNIEGFFTEKPHAVVLGNFDGFHLGHKAITDRLCHISETKGLVPSVVTFQPHPMKFFGADLKLIMTEESKIKAFAEAGVESMFILEFSRKFADIDPEVFVREFLVKKFRAVVVIVGYDYRFGRARSGDYNLLVTLGSKYGFTAVRVPKVTCGGVTVSSTNIRNFLLEGDMEKAAEFLGRPFFIEGKVVDGNKVGRQLGYPTANIDFRNELIPKAGIYISMAVIGGVRHRSVTNIGRRPTFSFPDQMKVETHIFDFGRDIYGEDTEIELLKYIRPEEKFPDVETLIKAIDNDCVIAKKWFEDEGY